MPELPELQALAEGLSGALVGRRVAAVRVWQPAAWKSPEPLPEALVGRPLGPVWRRGKLLGVEAENLTLVVHLMQAGRLGLAVATHRRPSRAVALSIALDGDAEELRLREAATEHRASVHLLDTAALARHRPLLALGPEPIGLPAEEWRSRLSARPAQLHAALRDGRRVAGIGRAYANDIMWAARLAPFARTDRIDEESWQRLARAADTVLEQALERARSTISTDLPNREARVTAVHGHAGDPCLRCGTRLERVSFVGFELVYCPTCQTGGRLYADRRRSKFLR